MMTNAFCKIRSDEHSGKISFLGITGVSPFWADFYQTKTETETETDREMTEGERESYHCTSAEGSGLKTGLHSWQCW